MCPFLPAWQQMAGVHAGSQSPKPRVATLGCNTSTLVSSKCVGGQAVPRTGRQRSTQADLESSQLGQAAERAEVAGTALCKALQPQRLQAGQGSQRMQAPLAQEGPGDEQHLQLPECLHPSAH